MAIPNVDINNNFDIYIIFILTLFYTKIIYLAVIVHELLFHLYDLFLVLNLLMNMVTP